MERKDRFAQLSNEFGPQGGTQEEELLREKLLTLVRVNEMLNLPENTKAEILEKLREINKIL